jgi:hypothetical protein
MDSVIELYECPPLRARMTAAQCHCNRARAEGPRTRRRLHKALSETSTPGRSECVHCPGVLWWARHTGNGPKTLYAEEIARGIALKEEQRRRLAGVPLLQLSSRRVDCSDEIASLLRSAGRL